MEGWYLESFAGDYGTAQQKYAQAHNIIALARAEWPGQADANLGGTSLQRTFCMLVQRSLDVLFTYTDDDILHIQGEPSDRESLNAVYK